VPLVIFELSHHSIGVPGFANGRLCISRSVVAVADMGWPAQLLAVYAPGRRTRVGISGQGPGVPACFCLLCISVGHGWHAASSHRESVRCSDGVRSTLGSLVRGALACQRACHVWGKRKIQLHSSLNWSFSVLVCAV